MGDRTAIGPYDFDQSSRHRPRHGADRARGLAEGRVGAAEHLRPRILYRRTGGRGGRRPVEYRLRYLKDARGETSSSRSPREPSGRRTPGRSMRRDENRPSAWGAASPMRSMSTRSFRASPRHGRPGRRTSPSIPATGEVSLTRVTVGQDSGLMINPEGVRHQIHGNVIQSTSRVLKEQVTFSDHRGDLARLGNLSAADLPRAPGHRRADGSRPEQSRSALANPPPCRARRRSPTPFSTRPASGSANRPSRPTASSTGCARPCRADGVRASVHPLLPR